MSTVRSVVIGIIAGGFLLALSPGQASAVCKTMEGSHNGTNMFHETGAVGAAINDLLVKVDQMKIEKGLKRVRMGRVRTKCGPWFEKYLLPHRNCVARARVCY